MHIDRGDTAVIICRVIIHALVRVEAGGIYRYLIFSLRDLAAAAHLLYSSEDMKELSDTLLFRAAGERIELRECGSDESRH